MNLAITTTSTNTLKTIKRSYVAAIGGVALTAVVLFGTLSPSTNTNKSPGQPSAPIASSARNVIPASPAMTYYIVGSEEQLLALQTEATSQVEDNAVYSPNSAWKFSILLANTPAATEDALDIVAAAKASWRAAGASGLQILDLR